MLSTPTSIQDTWLFNLEEVSKYIPNGTQSLSKSPSRFVDGVSPFGLISGKGCRVVGINDKVYIDYICGLGPVILGYRDLETDSMVHNVISKIGVSMSLPHPLEYVLAKLIESDLWIDGHCKSKFFKT